MMFGKIILWTKILLARVKQDLQVILENCFNSYSQRDSEKIVFLFLIGDNRKLQLTRDEYFNGTIGKGQIIGNDEVNFKRL